jgi:hypothetical protein
MENQVIHSFKKSETEEVRVSLRQYKEKTYLDVRVFFYSERDQEFRPTKKGVTFGTEFLGQLRSGLEMAEYALSEAPAVQQ